MIKAIADFTKAIELNPKDAGSYYNRGVVYYFKGNIEKACFDAKHACSLGYCKAYSFLQYIFYLYILNFIQPCA